MIHTGVPPGAARLGQWMEVQRDDGVWMVCRVPREHLENRSPVLDKKRAADGSIPISVPEKAAQIFDLALKVGDGWTLLVDMYHIGEHLKGNGGTIHQPSPPRRPRATDQIFPDDPNRRPSTASQRPGPLPEHAMGRSLRNFLANLLANS